MHSDPIVSCILTLIAAETITWFGDFYKLCGYTENQLSNYSLVNERDSFELKELPEPMFSDKSSYDKVEDS